MKTTLRVLVVKGNKEIYPQRMSHPVGCFGVRNTRVCLETLKVITGK